MPRSARIRCLLDCRSCCSRRNRRCSRADWRVIVGSCNSGRSSTTSVNCRGSVSPVHCRFLMKEGPLGLSGLPARPSFFSSGLQCASEMSVAAMSEPTMRRRPRMIICK
ncbi:hypothetical protein PMAYCL1PPCAC_14369, partial [Pristionchus mayeri]